MGGLTSLATKYLLMTFVFFSGYQGNTPTFSELKIERSSDFVRISSQLNEAFEEDFQTLFKSGKDIPIWFEVKLVEEKDVVVFNKFRHSVSYNPLTGFYTIYLEEENRYIKTKSFGKVKLIVSEVEYSFNYDFVFNKKYKIQVTSYLEKIYISSLDKEFNLKSLWRYNMPKIEKGFELDEKEN